MGKSLLIRGLTGRKVPVGRRPGVTTTPVEVQAGPVKYVDMGGFGFMSGLSRGEIEDHKLGFVRELERLHEEIDLALLVIDAKAFGEICDRWESRGEIPIDIEMHDFLIDLGIEVLVVANKMDKVDLPDRILDGIADRLGYLPPWRQWRDTIKPISAKTGTGISDLKREISERVGLT